MPTASAARALRALFTHCDIAAFDTQRFAIHQTGRNFAPCFVIHCLHGCARNAHLRSRLLLLQTLSINQADDLKFIQPEYDRLTRAANSVRAKLPANRQPTHTAAFFRSGHGLTVTVAATGMVAMRRTIMPFPVVLVVAALDFRIVHQ